MKRPRSRDLGLFVLDRILNFCDRNLQNDFVDNSVTSLFVSCLKAGCSKALSVFFEWGYVLVNPQLDQDHHYMLWIYFLKGTLFTQFTDLSTNGVKVIAGG
ncbi:hypothetical protein VCHA30O60_240040 [Vibrio chagasii]|nr:hypothetical protein VCHA30O60_240040 [Vibrio chagasii]